MNRLDEIVFYKPLTKADIARIIDLLMAGLNKRLSAQQLRCALTPAAKTLIADEGYDPIYGARPLRRYIQRHVETLISRKLVEGDLMPGTVLTVDARDGNPGEAQEKILTVTASAPSDAASPS